MKFGDKLVSLRKKNGLSQEELAEKLGVSRQSVSKWESNNSYPETDKIVQICNLFNCSMDNLINDSITDISEIERKEKNNISTYIDSFLEFITKTVNMFGDMKFSSGFKCVIEMIILSLLLALIGKIIVGITSSLISNLFSFIKGYYMIYDIIHSIFSIIWFIVAVIIIIHAFKIRYLDYYDKAKSERETTKDSNEKIKLDKKEQVIIRDEKDKPFAFLSVLSKIVIFFIKMFLVFFVLGMIPVVMGLSVAFALTIIHIGVSSIFVGASLSLISSIISSIVILIVIISYIFNKETKFKTLLIIFLSSIVFFGIGIGIAALSIKDLKYDESNNLTATKTEKLEYNNNMIIQSEYLNDIEYEFDESKGNNIEVIINYNDLFNTVDYYSEDYYGTEVYVFCRDLKDSGFINTYQMIIDDLKKGIIRNYETELRVKVVSSKETIDKLISNESKTYNFTKKETKNGYKLSEITHKIYQSNDCDSDIEYNALTKEIKKSDSCKCEVTENEEEIEINCE